MMVPCACGRPGAFSPTQLGSISVGWCGTNCFVSSSPTVDLRVLLIQAVTILRKVLDDSRQECDAGGRTTVDEARIVLFLEKLKEKP